MIIILSLVKYLFTYFLALFIWNIFYISGIENFYLRLVSPSIYLVSTYAIPPSKLEDNISKSQGILSPSLINIIFA